MQRKIKNLLPILLFLLVFAAIMCGLQYFYLTEQPEPVSAPKINDALISQDLQPVDITDASIIIAVAIIIAGILISNALSDGFTTLRESISYVGEISR